MAAPVERLGVNFAERVQQNSAEAINLLGPIELPADPIDKHRQLTILLGRLAAVLNRSREQMAELNRFQAQIAALVEMNGQTTARCAEAIPTLKRALVANAKPYCMARMRQVFHNGTQWLNGYRMQVVIGAAVGIAAHLVREAYLV